MSTSEDIFHNGIHITLSLNRDDVAFFDHRNQVWTEDSGSIVQDGHILIYFANISLNSMLFKEILMIFEKYNSTNDVYEYLRLVHKTLLIEQGELCADLILAKTVNNIIKNPKCKYNRSKVQKELIETFRVLVSQSKLFVDVIQKAISANDYSRIAMLINIAGDLNGGITYGMLTGRRKDGSYIFCDILTIHDGFSALLFELGQIANDKTLIKTCSNCGRYFIPKSRSDEIYCDFLHSNGKTCKEMGYESKVNSDMILKTYRRIYKTQNARKQRNLSNISDICPRFENWHNYAKVKLSECQSEKITLSEMEEAISSKDWMQGEINNGNDQ